MTTVTNVRDAYVPDAAAWADVSPAEVRLDPAKLEAAVDFALASDSPWPASLYYPDGRYVGNVEWDEKGPWTEIVGPVIPRGGPAGLILEGGRIAAEWGDTARADMTFSVAKSYLAVLAGLAVADGLIGSVDEPVGETRQGPMVRQCAQRRHHLAASAAAVERVAGRDLGQVRPGRSQPAAGRRRGQQPQGPAPRAQDPRHLLRVQRRAGEPAGLLPAAALRPRRCRRCCASASWTRSARPGTGSGTAIPPPGPRLAASACSRSRAARTGAAACSSARAIMRGSAC